MNNKYTISLVQTNTLIGRNFILPLSIGVLWNSAMTSQVNQQNWKLEHICYLQEDIENQAKIMATSDVVAMSMYIWNFGWQFDLAKRIKEINPKCFILMGGPWFTTNDTEFWNTYQDIVDLVALGEGDIFFRDFLESWPQGKFQTLPGAWTKDNQPTEAERLQDLNLGISPYLSGFYDRIIEEERKKGSILQVTIQTNRGCPYRCTFCEEGKEYKTKLYQSNIDTVKAEIDWCGENQIEYVSLADDNWGIFERDLEITEYFCITKKKYGYPYVLDITFAKNAPDRVLAIARIDKKHNTRLIRGITVSLQSTNQQTLSAIKRFNLVDSKKNNMIYELQKLNVPTYCEIIWPLPHETFQSFQQGLDHVIDSGLTSWCAVYPLLLYKSVDLYNDYINDYTFSDHVVNHEFKFHPQSNIMPLASSWVTHDQVVQGHVLYSWLANLYYFAWARPALMYLNKNLNMSWTSSVANFVTYLEMKDSHWGDRARTFKKFWQNWMNQTSTPVLNSSTTHEEIKFWYPYTHLAHWIRNDHQNFLIELQSWLSTYISDSIAEPLTYLCKHGVVNQHLEYPATLRDGTTIALDKEQKQFKNTIDASTYYFWHKRKKGINFIDITHSDIWNDVLKNNSVDKISLL